jgi:hypothetical protein
VSELKQSLKDMRAEVRRLREKMKAQCQTLFHDGMKELFANHPKLTSFSWTQYTPYFNDGDTCEFSVHKDYLHMEFDGQEFDEVSDYAFKGGSESDERKCVGLREAYEEVAEILDSLEESDFKSLFGDHVQVTATKDGVTADEYSHD